MMIKAVIRMGNDAVMAFDAGGEQLPEYQGSYRDVRASILLNAPPAAVFYHWFGHNASAEAVDRERW